MNGIASPALAALASALVHFLWQGTLVAAGLALSLRGERRAEVRYAYGCAALGVMGFAVAVTLAWSYRGGLESLSLAQALAAAGEQDPPPVERLTPATGILLGWALGAFLMLVRLAGGLAHVRWIIVGRAVDLPLPWAERVAELARRLGVTRAVRIAESAWVKAPLVVGWLRPVILVPISFVTSLPPSVIDAVILHELAHVRRLDWLVNALQAVFEALFFYHPGVHWVSRRLREAREECCDDAAVTLLGDPIGYARALTALEALRIEAPRLSLSSNGGALLTRILRLVSSNESGARPARGLGALFFSLACTVALGALPALACAAPAHEGMMKPGTTIDLRWMPATVTRWSPQVTAAAARHGVDPELLAIVTLVESKGNPDAESPSGALGLMQVMPATGEKIAAVRGIHDFSPDKLKDPSYNLDFGAWYLARQLEAFGDVELAAAAYNGGPGSVRRHLTNGTPLSDEATRYQARIKDLWSRRHSM